ADCFTPLLLALCITLSISLDLNPIEQVWDQLKQGLGDSSPPQSHLAELHVALVKEWNILGQNNIIGLLVLQPNIVPMTLNLSFHLCIAIRFQERKKVKMEKEDNKTNT
uniref:Uncharacterized protein n=1 Tax=Oryzias melastigma TaxID=30732 RepID=A0A3B3DD71_ORYME